jgi:hypothetical protein
MDPSAAPELPGAARTHAATPDSRRYSVAAVEEPTVGPRTPASEEPTAGRRTPASVRPGRTALRNGAGTATRGG